MLSPLSPRGNAYVYVICLEHEKHNVVNQCVLLLLLVLLAPVVVRTWGTNLHLHCRMWQLPTVSALVNLNASAAARFCGRATQWIDKRMTDPGVSY